jgi:hypothetical protein
MGLRCLLGHDFGDAEIEREREEDGNEMVVTIREVKTCERCGEQRVLSENKEVTSIRTPGEVGIEEGSTEGDRSGVSGPAETGGTPEPGAPSDPAGDSPADASDGPGARREDAAGDPFGGEAETADRIDAASAGAEADAGGPEASSTNGDDGDAAAEPTAHVEAAEEEFEAPRSAEEDDGVILDDDESTPRDRSVGVADEPGTDVELDDPSTDVDVATDAVEAEEEDDAEFIDAEADSGTDDGPVPWPEHDDVAPEEDETVHEEWPTPAGEDEGFDAEPDDGTPADVTFGGGLTPETDEIPDRTTDEAAAAANGETTFVDDGESADEEFVRAQGRTVELQTSAPDVDTEYYCPNCETTWPATDSSMRAGDICRKCRRGYVAEREL